jgi:hypothetical protein
MCQNRGLIRYINRQHVFTVTARFSLVFNRSAPFFQGCHYSQRRLWWTSAMSIRPPNGPGNLSSSAGRPPAFDVSRRHGKHVQ